MDHPPIGCGERAGKTLAGEIRDETCKECRAVFPGEGARSAQSDGAEWVEAEADADVLRRDRSGLDQSGEKARRIFRSKTEVEIDGDAGIEMDLVERRADRGAGRGQRIAVIADGAFEHEIDAVRAIIQIVEDLRVGGLGVGVVDPLHDVPRLARCAARDRARVLRARNRAARRQCRHRSWT